MEQPIINDQFIIQKMDVKGGWHYITLPYSKFAKTKNPFGWIIVKGKIDDYSISQYKLWPTKEGKLFLALKKDIRKQIQKEAGQKVTIILYVDNSNLVIPVDFAVCLADAPKANYFFETLSTTSKKQYIDWIYNAKNSATIETRMTTAIKKLEQGLKYHEKEI
jgi:hypothetical protein